jgi:hypothetical protein
MSGRRRNDSLSRKLSEVDRRKRRNLGDFPVRASGTAAGGDVDVPPGGCPNLAPSDAAEIKETQQDTAEKAGPVYGTVFLADTGIVPGHDEISYCFEGMVGPPGGNEVVDCDGDLALTENGLVFTDLINGQLPPDGFDGFWSRYNKETGIFGSAGLKFASDGTGYWVEVRANGGGISNIIRNTTEDNDYGNPRDNWAVQADFRRIYYEGSTSRQPVAAIVAARGQDLGIFDYGYVGGHFHTNLSPAGLIGRYSSGSWTSLQQGIQSGDGLTFQIKDYEQECFFLADGVSSTGSPYVTTDAGNLDTEGGVGLMCNRSLTVYSPQMGDWGCWFQNIICCKQKPITFTGIPTGWYVRLCLRDGIDGYECPPQLQAQESSNSITFPSRGTGSPNGIANERWPFPSVQFWDGDPSGSGVLQVECAPSRGIYPGDTWNFSFTGGQVVDDTVLDAQATIEMKLYDAYDNLLNTYEPTGAISEGFTRTPDTQVLGIPIPWNAENGYMIFTPYKRGTSDSYAKVRNLQVNIGGEVCCEYTTPGELVAQSSAVAAGLSFVSADDVVEADVEGTGVAEPHVERIYDDGRSDGTPEGSVMWTGEQIGDSWEEHRESTQNIMDFDGHAEQNGPGVGTAGDPAIGCGYDYEPIDVEKFGVIAGTDIVSLRFKGKVV